ncbi:MAG: hypothetical protein RBU36_17580 [Thermoanaerobaculia bacterium]|jgi:hypothetical protein|nr:hypothetical protein [Thermoanaerobaculia bacterium]
MRITHWTKSLLSERARRHEAARWEETTADALRKRKFYGCAGISEAVSAALDEIAAR